MKKIVSNRVRPFVQRLGFDIVRHEKGADAKRFPRDFSERVIEICETVGPYTMTSPERVNATIGAVCYVEENDIGGAFVECGVWKGGSVMAMALTLQGLERQDREFYLYDTYAGMSEPSEADESGDRTDLYQKFNKTIVSEGVSEWCLSMLDEVKQNVFSTGYPETKNHFIKGKVEDTIPANLPGEIAILRLDTDWYESTKHELIHLFPLLKQHGVLIIDDYGHWQGARKAVDEYFAENEIQMFLSRIDYTCRLGIKT